MGYGLLCGIQAGGYYGPHGSLRVEGGRLPYLKVGEKAIRTHIVLPYVFGAPVLQLGLSWCSPLIAETHEGGFSQLILDKSQESSISCNVSNT
jgi:hypothetical protein